MKNLTSSVSATAMSCLYARDEKIAKARVLLTGVALCSVFMLSLSGAAQAGTADLKSYATEVSGKTNVIVDIISYICYIGGAGLAALGIVDLKKHVENPQTPVKQGLAKLGFGGMLLTLPYITNMMQSTTGASGGGATFKKFTAPPTI